MNCSNALRFALKRFQIPLVDLCNAVSLAFALPIAVIDLDQVAGDIQVRHADGDEIALAFSGEVEHPDPGEATWPELEQAHTTIETLEELPGMFGLNPSHM